MKDDTRTPAKRLADLALGVATGLNRFGADQHAAEREARERCGFPRSHDGCPECAKVATCELVGSVAREAYFDAMRRVRDLAAAERDHLRGALEAVRFDLALIRNRLDDDADRITRPEAAGLVGELDDHVRRFLDLGTVIGAPIPEVTTNALQDPGCAKFPCVGVALGEPGCSSKCTGFEPEGSDQ